MLQKTRWFTAMLLVVVVIGVVTVCHMHTTLSLSEHTTSSPHSTDSSAHSMLDSCVVTILPVLAMLLFVLVSMFYTRQQLLHHIAPVFSLFIPPRYATR